MRKPLAEVTRRAGRLAGLAPAAAFAAMLTLGGCGGSSGLPDLTKERERPKVDRVACPWLIRRFVDPSAVFHYVAPEWVRDIAEETGATPFDIDGVVYSHRGEMCSFDTMLDEFGLDTPALRRMARIVRGADTARPDLEPQAAGLLAILLGLSAMESDDIRLQRGNHFYDARRR